MQKNRKAVIGLSGGMDSAVLLGILLEQGYEVHCCVFTYGSKHNKYENQAADSVIVYYQHFYGDNVVSHFFDLTDTFSHIQSDLLLTGGEIPEGHYESESMKKTAVPGRNMIFASIMAGVAESIEAECIALGVHSGDHAIYPDCRHEFIKALDCAIYLSTDKSVQVVTPLVQDDKASILVKGYALKVEAPIHLTRTCYKDQEYACGKCGSCQERLEAFSIINKKDPVRYE